MTFLVIPLIFCLDKTMDEVNHDIKQYASLTQNQRQIRITPGNRKLIQATIDTLMQSLHFKDSF